MRSILLFFTFSFVCNLSFGQLDQISGFWKGKFKCQQTGENIEVELQLIASPYTEKNWNYLQGTAKGSGKQIINGREYQFQLNSFVHKDNSLTARIYKLVDTQNQDEIPQFSQELILLLEKRGGQYALTGNWLFPYYSHQDCTKGNILLERTTAKIRP